MNELGKRLRARRAALGLKQDELAARLFVTRQTISNYERGLSEPDLDMLRRLAEALETEPAVLLGSETAARKGSGKKELLSFLLGLVLTAGVAALFIALEKQAFAWKGTHYDIVPYERVSSCWAGRSRRARTASHRCRRCRGGFGSGSALR